MSNLLNIVPIVLGGRAKKISDRQTQTDRQTDRYRLTDGQIEYEYERQGPASRAYMGKIVIS